MRSTNEPVRSLCDVPHVDNEAAGTDEVAGCTSVDLTTTHLLGTLPTTFGEATLEVAA